jgi:hypothetical protein
MSRRAPVPFRVPWPTSMLISVDSLRSCLEARNCGCPMLLTSYPYFASLLSALHEDRLHTVTPLAMYNKRLQLGNQQLFSICRPSKISCYCSVTCSWAVSRRVMKLGSYIQISSVEVCNPRLFGILCRAVKTSQKIGIVPVTRECEVGTIKQFNVYLQ